MNPLAEQLRLALAAAADMPGDPLMPEPDWPEPIPAAVLIAITDRAKPGVLLTRRAAGLRNHGGQVAFPGGRVDAEDDGPVAAALREAEEEIGLPRDVPLVVDTLPRFLTISDYLVTPVVAVVPPDLPLVPRAAEVALCFEVPLAQFVEPANRITREILFRGRPRCYYEFVGTDERIWGATAAMLVDLMRRLGPNW